MVLIYFFKFVPPFSWKVKIAALVKVDTEG